MAAEIGNTFLKYHHAMAVDILLHQPLQAKILHRHVLTATMTQNNMCEYLFERP